jgi:hypothetical protein
MANARIQFSSRQSRITIACIMAGIFDNLEFHASPREHCIRELLAIWPMRKDGEFPTRICFIPFSMFPMFPHTFHMAGVAHPMWGKIENMNRMRACKNDRSPCSDHCCTKF